MTIRTAVKTLLVLVLGLPILQSVFGWVSRLLVGMGDSATADVLGHINTAAGVVWLVGVVGLVVALAIQALEEPVDG